MRKLTHQEILTRQQEKKTKKTPFCVILNDLRSCHNVGSIFRTADGAGVEKIWLCGITACPPNKQINKTALDAQDHVSWEYRKDALSVIQELKQQNYQIILLEQMEGSRLYHEFTPHFPTCLIIGNETDGISPELISHCDAAIEIEMAGIKNSLNVAVAFGIAAYYFRNYFLAPKINL